MTGHQPSHPCKLGQGRSTRALRADLAHIEPGVCPLLVSCGSVGHTTIPPLRVFGITCHFFVALVLAAPRSHVPPGWWVQEVCTTPRSWLGAGKHPGMAAMLPRDAALGSRVRWVVRWVVLSPRRSPSCTTLRWTWLFISVLSPL